MMKSFSMSRQRRLANIQRLRRIMHVMTSKELQQMACTFTMFKIAASCFTSNASGTGVAPVVNNIGTHYPAVQWTCTLQTPKGVWACQVWFYRLWGVVYCWMWDSCIQRMLVSGWTPLFSRPAIQEESPIDDTSPKVRSLSHKEIPGLIQAPELLRVRGPQFFKKCFQPQTRSISCSFGALRGTGAYVQESSRILDGHTFYFFMMAACT